jgi:hypothetical protein
MHVQNRILETRQHVIRAQKETYDIIQWVKEKIYQTERIITDLNQKIRQIYEKLVQERIRMLENVIQ